MVKKNKELEKKMLAAQEKMRAEIEAAKPKKRKTIKEQYEEIKESRKSKVKDADSENSLIAELFDIVNQSEEVLSETSKPIIREKTGL